MATRALANRTAKGGCVAGLGGLRSNRTGRGWGGQVLRKNFLSDLLRKNSSHKKTNNNLTLMITPLETSPAPDAPFHGLHGGEAASARPSGSGLAFAQVRDLAVDQIRLISAQLRWAAPRPLQLGFVLGVSFTRRFRAKGTLAAGSLLPRLLFPSGPRLPVSAAPESRPSSEQWGGTCPRAGLHLCPSAWAEKPRGCSRSGSWEWERWASSLVLPSRGWAQVDKQGALES